MSCCRVSSSSVTVRLRVALRGGDHAMDAVPRKNSSKKEPGAASGEPYLVALARRSRGEAEARMQSEIYKLHEQLLAALEAADDAKDEATAANARAREAQELHRVACTRICELEGNAAGGAAADVPAELAAANARIRELEGLLRAGDAWIRILETQVCFTWEGGQRNCVADLCSRWSPAAPALAFGGSTSPSESSRTGLVVDALLAGELK